MTEARYFKETPCEDCSRYHQEPLLRPGGHPESSIAYCHVGGTRREVTIDYEAARTEIAAWFDEYRKSSEITAATWAAVDAALVVEPIDPSG